MEGKTLGVLKAHVALYVSDVGRSVEFYGRMLGLEPCKVRRGYAKFDAAEPPLNLTLNERAGAKGGALSHMGIQVASTGDVLALRERWRAAGLETFDEFGTSCCYAVQDKTWVRDPDGNEWEAFVVLEDNLPETAACECGSKTHEAQAAAEKQADVEGGVETQAGASCCATATAVKGGQAVDERVATCCAPSPVPLTR
jgi:catechol 2,3-dioxygenase-like lactoylglutathione lyase family enzyme